MPQLIQTANTTPEQLIADLQARLDALVRVNAALQAKLDAANPPEFFFSWFNGYLAALMARCVFAASAYQYKHGADGMNDDATLNRFHYPQPDAGQVWVQVSDAPQKTWTDYPIPFIVNSRPQSGGWVMIFSSLSDVTPKLRSVTYNMEVSQVVVDTKGVVWLKVYNDPVMFVLADQVMLKSTNT